jgi:hypothetical protein
MGSEKLFYFLKEKGIISGFETYEEWREAKGYPETKEEKAEKNNKKFVKELNDIDRKKYDYMFGELDF